LINISKKYYKLNYKNKINMSKSKQFFNQISKLIESGIYNYKDLSNEFISILKSKRDELIFKLKITSSEETEVLIKRVEILEKKIVNIEKLNKKKVKKVKK
tara:strand:+ start:2475 stop:2777 length:303 start_codon:yes stop_codon:yes gene_type:complete